MGHTDEGGHGQGHAHGTWVKPPERYREMSSRVWGDPQAIARGRELYAENCQVCHGSDGQGTGVAADSLEHPPADLTSHLHSRYGNNDGYLFWRVTKGGTVEPFKSRDSAMPAFENVLTEQQRWDVLAYVHDVYHQGFVEDLRYEAENGDSGTSHGQAREGGHHGEGMAHAEGN
ncbi:MAG: cytochrome c [Gammaproteobacteria bacterium]|nr:cytochrome c [Gammaproteobacteria bacterium]